MNNNAITLNIIKKSKKNLSAYQILDKFQEIKKPSIKVLFDMANILRNFQDIH